MADAPFALATIVATLLAGAPPRGGWSAVERPRAP